MKVRQENEDAQFVFIKEAERYPYAEMSNHKWVPKTSNQRERVSNLLSFFAVTDFRNIIEKGAFRISSKHAYSIPAITSWLRKGSIDGTSINTTGFDETRLRSNLSALRLLTKEANPNKMMKEIGLLLASCGIAFVLTPSLKNAPINGATRWLNSDKVLLQLSLRYKYADIFWFSLFHEIGHVLFENKKDFNIDLVKNFVEPEKEKKADKFACDELISLEIYEKFKAFLKKNPLSGADMYRVITRFSEKINIHPGIVSGRLQNDGILPRNMNKLRTRLEWA